MIQNKRFMIDKIPVVPNEMMNVPNGQVLCAAFIGSVANVWIKIEEGDDRLMGLIVLPNGGPYRLDETDDFHSAYHVTSLLKLSSIKLKGEAHSAGVAFHVFVWPPKAVLATDLLQ